MGAEAALFFLFSVAGRPYHYLKHDCTAKADASLAAPPPIRSERMPGGNRLAGDGKILEEWAVVAHPMGAFQPTPARKLTATIRIKLLYSIRTQRRITQNVIMQTNLALLGQMVNKALPTREHEPAN